MKLFLTVILSCFIANSYAQTFNNEWINFNQTYYKFRLGKEGVYRIPKSLLDAVGIGNAEVKNLELWRNGVKVPIYPSVSSGVLPADGYIEFWGVPNDGEPDKAMYREAAFQHTTKYSLQSDTSNYFLSVNNDQSGKIVKDQANNVTANTLPVENYFMQVTGNYFKERMNLGNALIVGEYIYSSSYDRGEYWSSAFITPAAPRTVGLSNLNVYPSGPSSQIRFGANGNSLNSRTIRLSVNNTQLVDTLTEYFYDVQDTVDFPTSLISSNTANVKIANNSAVSSDRLTASYFELVYPRNFDFSGQANFEFYLPADNDGYYLEITNFNAGTKTPVLYDLTTASRYVADIGVAGKLRFVLPPAVSSRKFILVSQDPTNITVINTLKQKQFKNFSNILNQGNYLIISHPSLNVGTSGRKPLDEYKAYRSSAAGGSYQVVLADIDELVDQFAFGINKHPLSVRNFLKFARTRFVNPVSFCFLVGRGMTYNEYRANVADTSIDRLNIVPTFGTPASDNLLSAESLLHGVPSIPIGRLAVVKGTEIEDYLQKVTEYEAVQKNAPNTMEGRGWMKNFLHVTGASDPYLGVVLCDYMGIYRELVQDTLIGAKVHSFCKNSTNPLEEVSADKIKEVMAEGVSALTYFGHSSATALEFNIENPEAYNNQGKYPVFFVNGCNAGNFFTYYPQRLLVNETLSEKFVLAKQRGSIGFVASTHFGIVNYLNIYLYNLYQGMSGKVYGQSLGALQKNAFAGMLDAVGDEDFYARTHVEQITINGDPSIKLNVQPKPDYVVEESMIKVNPSFISIAEDSFKVQVNIGNLGRAIEDSIRLQIKRQFPDGSSEIIWNQKIKGVRQMDSVQVVLPLVATRDKGNNRITATIDSDQSLDEMSESNNMAVKDFFIYEDEARPVYPYNLSIVNNRSQKLYASTANPFSLQKNYVMEMDTTLNFNSPLKTSSTVAAIGGILEFQPTIVYKDSAVYYWRIALKPDGNAEYRWNSSSFQFIPGNDEGFSQAHYFQHAQSQSERLVLDSAARRWKFLNRKNTLNIRNGVFPTAASQAVDISIEVNSQYYIKSVCGISNLIFCVFDSTTFQPWLNAMPGSPSQYGSDAVCGVDRIRNFQFNILDTANRRKIMNFMDLIPDGSFVVVRNTSGTAPTSNTYAKDWMKDTAYFGSNNTIYHRLKMQGFSNVDSFNVPRSFIFVYQKNRNGSFTPKSTFSQGINDRINMMVECYTPDSVGYISSPKLGPSKAWNKVQWQGASLETNAYDNPSVDVVGISKDNQETILYSMGKDTRELDLSGIDASEFPFMKLRMRNIDSIALSPYQLKSWKVFYKPAPEGALAPNLSFNSKDTVEVGENFNLNVAFKNISKSAFDSLKVKLIVIDRNNQQHVINLPKAKALITGDSIMVRVSLDTRSYVGSNILLLDVNPDNDQQEQQHFNNFLYRNFYVKADNTNPLMDLTFDGLHILNRDLVSSKPRILIKLKDNAKFLLLNDTSLSTVQVRYPNGVLRTFAYGNDTLRFIPAVSGQDNVASIEFTPNFSGTYNPEGDEYELIVKGKDVSGNKAGEVAYKVVFKVVSKAMISNMLNYPNPFSSATAFVFTLTGSEIPQQLKIQILTVTGKIVREITKDELGPLHIGRNITEFKWDGTDQYGEKLANGIYLYRVVAGMNGQSMDKYRAEGDNTSKFFNNGYGKMYLMR